MSKSNAPRSHGVLIVVGDRRYRLERIASGDVVIHDNQGQKVHLKAIAAP
jgi:phage gp45-like